MREVYDKLGYIFISLVPHVRDRFSQNMSIEIQIFPSGVFCAGRQVISEKLFFRDKESYAQLRMFGNKYE